MENQKLVCILIKNPYIMILLIAQYLLVGTILGFLIESVIRNTGSNVDYQERIWLIILWPLMLVIFVIYFIKGLNED